MKCQYKKEVNNLYNNYTICKVYKIKITEDDCKNCLIKNIKQTKITFV